MVELGARRWGIVALTVLTAVIHIVLFFVSPQGGFIFLLNGLGYIGLLIALYFFPPLADMRNLVRWGLIAYTAVTFVLYFIFNWPDIWAPLGLIDKAIELVLIILLWMDAE